MTLQDSIRRTNAAAYDAMAKRQHPLCTPATAEEIANAVQTIDPTGWFDGPIAGRHVLCLAAGGGRHSRLYLAAGANVTVVDLSEEMLRIDRENRSDIAAGKLRVVRASMDNLSMLQPGEFDLVVHPVSTCYLDSLTATFSEVARVLRPGGLYISQHKSPTSLQTSIHRGVGGHYEILHDQSATTAVPPPTQWDETAGRLRERGAIEFIHSLDSIIGGICRGGFVIEDFRQPDHRRESHESDAFSRRAAFVPPYLRIKARRIGRPRLLAE